MYRTSSNNRVSDEFLVNLSPAAKVSLSLKSSAADLPVYELISDATKKETPLQQKSLGDNAIHLIPLVLVLCGLILWWFSSPTKMLWK
ncbi:hypothetical protein Acr_13g0011920 [Actinidia rufa]|uniref:Uncharacterized protein n=1 Tax=Actinidia rufa TaxID=165716 RepID=A0A7J0FM33_9ERIC|nr:hypothetical protein Acr_13g0011920 [Actinidia rufa]